MTRRTARALGAAIGLALCATGVTWIVAAASERPGVDGVAGSSWTMSPFTRHDELFPLLKSDGATFACPVSGKPVRWRETYVFNPAAVVRGGRVYLLFRAEDAVGTRGGTSRIGLAESRDGFHFEADPLPVLYPDRDAFLEYEREGGCEDPRVVEREDGTYVMTYTSFNGTLARLSVATSPDLRTWTKHGLAFGKAKGGRYSDLWSKSGAIVCRRVGDRLVATKVNGRYWMYWGETDIYLAVSDDLVEWEPVLKEEKTGKRLGALLGKGQYEVLFDAPRTFFKTAVSIRDRRFDSGLVEPGPPALLTPRGIFFIYNASNDAARGDASLRAGEYTVGEVLFDRLDPSAVIARCERYFLRAERQNEVSGQMENTAFVEGMVPFRGKWFVYYTMAEAGIGVATSERDLD
jgi:predicted GH43/DUF377 family glycosyl hydrolase